MGKGGGGGNISGYRYSLSMLMGVCRGPVDQIVQIKVNDLNAFTGPITTNEDFSIAQPNLFGGDDKEGGIDGLATVMMGTSTQLIAGTRARSIITGFMSSLRGVVTLFFDGLVCANNPYPKKWAFRVRRTKAGWFNDTPWYPDEATVLLVDVNGNQIYAMNPAHIIMEVLTNPVWGRGLPMSVINETSFISAANYLCREQFGLCLKWSRDLDIDQFLQLVFSHLSAVLFVDRTTGLLNLKLLRNDYDADTLPVFDYSSGLLQLTNDDTTAPDNSHSEIIVNWVDPVSNGKRQTRVQNLAGVRASQTIASTSVDYIGIPTQGLAARVGLRDLQMQGAGIKRYTVKMDRRARKLNPGSVFKINIPQRNIDNMILRAFKIEEGGNGVDQIITITAIQDVFGLEKTTYVTDPTGTWTPPDRTLLDIDTYAIQDINYLDTARTLTAAHLATVAVDSGDPVIAVMQPSAMSTAYELDTAGSGEAYADHGTFVWTPTALSTSDLDEYDTTLTFDTPSNVSADTLGTPGFIAWLDNELIQVQAYDLTTNTLTIGRGCVDTIPAKHAPGARIWFTSHSAGVDGREYTTGEAVKVKLLTRTNTGILAEADATEHDFTILGRQGLPYPPGNFKINTVAYADVTNDVNADLVFSWAHRDRITQADHVLVHGDGSTGPEASVTYTVRVYNYGDPTAIHTETGITAATWTYDAAAQASDSAGLRLTVKLKAVRDGLDSYQEYVWTFYRAHTGYGYGYGLDYGGSP